MGYFCEARVFKRIMPIPESGCWIWMGATAQHGYGHIQINNTFSYIHRWMYEKYKGPIPEGCELDHLCRVKSCCNPDHLEAVTHQENILRGTAPSAMHAKKTHCPRGHSYDSVRRAKYGISRRCLQCHREQERNRQRMKRGHSLSV